MGIDAGLLKSHEVRRCSALRFRTCQQKTRLDRRVAMPTQRGRRRYAVREGLGEYRVSQLDTDTDTDTDLAG